MEKTKTPRLVASVPMHRHLASLADKRGMKLQALTDRVLRHGLEAMGAPCPDDSALAMRNEGGR